MKKLLRLLFTAVLALSLSAVTFAQDTGSTAVQLSRYEQGSSEMGAEVLLRLTRISREGIDWILTDKGSD
jgi:transcriptional regulator with XRE-family HTH domain